MKKLNKFQIEEMRHHDIEAVYYAKRNEKDYIWEVPAERYLLKKRFIKEGDVVVDMGCGPSTLIKHVFTKKKINNIKYIGVDISKNMLKIAKRNIPDGEFIQGEMETIRMRHKANVIISLGALHHAENKQKTLRNWLKILKNNGFLLLREPTKESLKRGSGESPNEEGVDLEEIKVFASKNKVKVIRVFTFWSPIFHIINKCLIKCGLGSWRDSKKLWSVALTFDSLIIDFFSQSNIPIRGDSIAVVLQKDENSF